MAANPDKLELFQAALASLEGAVTDDLHLPSLLEKRLEGFAALYVIVIPILNSAGQVVFADLLLKELFFALNNRFGGCMVASLRSHPPYWGLWQPTGAKASEGEKDYVTTVQIYANPIEATNRYFSQLKKVLKTAGNIVQEEILISRIDCWLV